MEFDYNAAFAINSGILSTYEQSKLRQTRVFILGMCAGGSMAIMLARTGIEKFILVDDNKYHLSDMNRDAGCYVDTLNRFKAEVIKEQIKRINPGSEIITHTDAISLETLGDFIDQCDVLLAQSDDLALSVQAIKLAQSKNILSATCMPSGVTAYVEIYPPNMKHIIDPAVLFGSPENLSYRQLYYFLRNPLNRCGRRWHITEGKWRVSWFQKWRDREVFEPQFCPNMWLGAAITCNEVIKQLLGKWNRVVVPNMWHFKTMDNKVRLGRYRRRSWWFERLILWTFSIQWLGIGHRYQKYTAKRLMRELEYMAKQEAVGKKLKLPWIWHFI